MAARSALRSWTARAVALSLAIACTAIVPSRIASRRADDFFDGDAASQRALAASAREILRKDDLAFHTGSARFDGEWFLIVHMAATLGFAQTSDLASARAAADRVVSDRATLHDRDAWGEDPRAALAEIGHGHLAYLGYANLALSRLRRADPGDAHAALNDALTEALARRYASSDGALLESYPGETYPADNAAALASIALHDRAAGGDHGALVRRALDRMRALYTDPTTGLLFQRAGARDARASGTAMAAFVLGYAAPDDARRLWDAVARQWSTVLGFGGAREYPAVAAGGADVDSGPVIFGLGVSATAFSLASARRFGDRARFRSAFASLWLFGLPHDAGDALSFVAGGPLGDTLLFALLTAEREP